mmetsp:Transcript_12619/g.22529  ORF Transcript_12619/g.22529 Transcript_12619/m.22529 type:complete len:261 (+) Transcript_12619:549-1331(+)
MNRVSSDTKASPSAAFSGRPDLLLVSFATTSPFIRPPFSNASRTDMSSSFLGSRPGPLAPSLFFPAPSASSSSSDPWPAAAKNRLMTTGIPVDPERISSWIFVTSMDTAPTKKLISAAVSLVAWRESFKTLFRRNRKRRLSTHRHLRDGTSRGNIETEEEEEDDAEGVEGERVVISMGVRAREETDTKGLILIFFSPSLALLFVGVEVEAEPEERGGGGGGGGEGGVIAGAVAMVVLVAAAMALTTMDRVTGRMKSPFFD